MTKLSVGCRSDRLHLDTADTISRGDTDLDVSFISPSGAPRVLHEVVSLSIYGSISDGENKVINVSSTGSSGEDTSFVLSESTFVSFDHYGSGSLSDGGLEGVRATSFDTYVTGRLNVGLLLGALLASSIHMSVWVGRLQFNVISLVERETCASVTTRATFVRRR
jgi:hypothetical protein